MFPLLACATFCILLIYLAFKRITRKKPKLPYPPGPPPTSWFFGNALELPDVRVGHHLDIKLLEWAKEYGTYFTFTIPVVGRMIVVGDPDLAKHVLISKNFGKSFTYKMFSPLFGEQSLLVLPDKEWFAKRRAFNPGFAPLFLKNVVEILSDKVDRLLEGINQDIKAKRETDMLARSQVFTSDVIVQVAFGEDWGVEKSLEMRRVHTELQALTSAKGANVSIMLFGVPTWIRIRKLTKQLDYEMRNVLERRLAAGPSANSKDICSLAIDQMRGNDGNLTEADKLSIVHQLKTFYFAGNDTTATLISWTIWMLSQHRDVLEKVRGELKELKVWVDNKTPTYDQLLQCKYFEAVFKEVLRLYPPASSARYTPDVSESWRDPKTNEEYTLGGAVIYVSHYVMHRHPDLWNRPDDFVPERFLDGSEENMGSKFQPFSRGPRDCLGKYFAMLEAKLAVSRLCLDYDFECVDPNEEFCYRVTSVPRNGAKVTYTPRKR